MNTSSDIVEATFSTSSVRLRRTPSPEGEGQWCFAGLFGEGEAVLRESFEKPIKMELELIRTYFPNGTNGDLIYKGKHICFTIELPWLYNKPGVSCIPEGRYELEKYFSEHLGNHLHVKAVADRSMIMIHAANNALEELRGCIAPVSILTAEGKGLRSRVALKKVLDLTYPVLDRKEKVFLTITSSAASNGDKVP